MINDDNELDGPNGHIYMQTWTNLFADNLVHYLINQSIIH